MAATKALIKDVTAVLGVGDKLIAMFSTRKKAQDFQKKKGWTETTKLAKATDFWVS